jgi:hypothetical protein
MAHITRFIIDFITEDELSERRQQIMGGEMSENLHLLVQEVDDEMINVSGKYVNAHTHDATQDACNVCQYHAYDSKNGDVVVAND